MKWILITLCFFLSCKNFEGDYVKSNLWMYDSGIYRGDFLDFKDSKYMSLKNDTVIKNGKAILVITGTNKKLFELYTKSLDSDSTGIYVSTAMMFE